jgi:hypothetical protein
MIYKIHTLAAFSTLFGRDSVFLPKKISAFASALILVNERYFPWFGENEVIEIVAAGEQPATLVRMSAYGSDCVKTPTSRPSAQLLNPDGGIGES